MDNRDIPDDMKGHVFFAESDKQDLPDCSEHGEVEKQRMRLNHAGEIWVSQDGYKLHYCPDCLITGMDQKATEDIYTEDQALHVFLAIILAEDEKQSPLKRYMNNLGEGEVIEQGVRLAENPPLEDIPEWLFDDGLYFADSDEIKSIDEAYREEFIERFGREPETIAGDEKG